jgi:transposase-like protein
MAAPWKYPDEMRKQSVRLVLDLVDGQDAVSVTGACARVAEQLGINRDTLRGWVKQAQIDQGRSLRRRGARTVGADGGAVGGRVEAERVASLARAARFGWLTARKRGTPVLVMVGVVDAAGRWRWERLLLLVAVMLGVVTMHSLAVAPGTHCPNPPAIAVTGGVTMSAGPHAASADGCHHGPGSCDLLHLCLGVVAAAVVLALAAVAVAALIRRTIAGPRRLGVVVQPRPPPRTAVRLALLCVLRN